MKTEDSNKLIAEFMGLHFDIEVNQIPAFDKDWNKLIPVVETIEKKVIRFEIGRESALITLRALNFPEIYVESWAEANSKLDATYKAVVQFIQWYNQNH